MKRILMCLAAGVVLSVIGVFAVGPWWEGQEAWRTALGRWFSDREYEEMAGFTNLLWPHASMWALAAVGGVFAGVAASRRAMVGALALGVGLVAIPLILALGQEQATEEAVSPGVMIAWNLIAAGVVFPFAVLGRLLAGGGKATGGEPSQQEAEETAAH